ncbi:hypothetical protein Angca_001619, partial [Angiostrongylus cantonensis]
DITRLLLTISTVDIEPAEPGPYVNLFFLATTFCICLNDTQTYKVKITDILQINSFMRETCFRLIRNETTLHKTRI